MYVLTPELYSTKYRAVGLGSASVVTRLGGALLVFRSWVILVYVLIASHQGLGASRRWCRTHQIEPAMVMHKNEG